MAWTAIPGASARRHSTFGGAIRRLVERVTHAFPLHRRGCCCSTAFTAAFVALAAKMAKADGIAVEAEAQAFERYIVTAGSDRVAIRKLYDQAKQDTAGYEAYARQIGVMLQDDPVTRRAVFECLMYVACADGILHAKEDEFLHGVATAFGMSDTEVRAVRCQFVHDIDCPYEVLGLEPNASDRELKTRYRHLAGQFHPDIMMARGEPQTVQQAANARLAQINAAYESIRKERRAA